MSIYCLQRPWQLQLVGRARSPTRQERKMLTNILILLAVSAGSLVAERSEEESTVKSTVVQYVDGASVDTTIAITKDTVQITSDGISVIVDYKEKRIAVKPKGEETCMIIEGIGDLGEDFPTLKQMKEVSKQKTLGIPTSMKELKVEQSETESKLSDMEEKMCPNKNVWVEISTAECSASKKPWKKWWPWWNWWLRPCPWCRYHYRWPCFQWPYWFYYYKYMFAIYPCW